jgi:hypothetical protein
LRLRNIQLYGLLAFLIPFAFYLMTLNGLWSSDYQASILGLQYSIWAHHSFSLGNQSDPIITSVDMGNYQGGYYSAISPGFAFLSLPFASLGFILDGGRLNVWGYAPLMDEVFLALVSSLAAFFAYKISRLYSGSIAGLLASLSFSLGTSVWPISTMIFIHGASVFLSVVSVYLILISFGVASTETEPKKKEVRLAIAGLTLGLACFVEYAAALFFIPLVVFVLMESRKLSAGPKVKANLTSFSLPFLFGPALQLICNELAFGNPLMFPEDVKLSGGASLTGQFSLLAIPLHMIFYAVSPYRGLLFFSPVLVLGVYGLYLMSKREDLKSTSILFLSLFLLILVFYSSWSDWGGGLAYGPRFLILGLPYLAIPLSFFLTEKTSASSRALFMYLFAISTIVEGIGALTTALSSSGDFFSFQPFSLNMAWLLQGKLDTWWLLKLGASDISTFQLFAISIFQVELVLVLALVTRLKLRPSNIIQESIPVSVAA